MLGEPAPRPIPRTPHPTPHEPVTAARRVIKGAVFGVRAIVMQAVGFTIGQSLFLVLLVRSIPEPGALARGALSTAAAGVGIPADMASQVAGQAVSYVDSSILGGLITFADNIRLLAWLILALSLAVFGLAVTLIGRGATRVRWAGWGFALAGASLFLWAGVVYGLGVMASGAASGNVAVTIRRFARDLVAPMWTAGIALAVMGGAMVAGGWANLIAALRRRRVAV